VTYYKSGTVTAQYLIEFNDTIPSTETYRQTDIQTVEMCYRACPSDVRTWSHLGRRRSNWDCLWTGRS